jgi:hypothetical protein
MYAFLPFLFLWTSGTKTTWKLVGLWIVSVAAAFAQPHIPGLGRLSILLFIPCFLPGVIAYSLQHRRRISSTLWLPFIFLLTLIFTLRPVLSTGWYLCLVLGLMIPQFREIQSHWLRYVSNRIATYSYGIYLSHQFCIWLAFGVLASHSLVLKIPFLVVTLVTAPVILYHVIEAPLIKSGNRWANAIV